MSDELAQQQRKLRLKKTLKKLSGMRGMGTELVTVIIPPDRMIHDVRQQLGQEAGQAANIKSKSTRKHVSDALESAVSMINRYKTPGDGGLAIFVGHVVVGNNKTRLVTTVVDDPPEPFSSFRYRCDSSFETSQLEEMLIHAAEAYEVQVESKLQVLTSLLEPLMILIMGGFVSLLVMSILMPLLRMNEAFQTMR